jgi:hypothetical protein
MSVERVKHGISAMSVCIGRCASGKTGRYNRRMGVYGLSVTRHRADPRMAENFDRLPEHEKSA